jgi:hypothetical protein
VAVPRSSRERNRITRDFISGGVGRLNVPGGGATAALATAPGTTARQAWVAWLKPVFAGCDSAYFTGTYSDDYGLSHGCTLPRNVHKDFRRFLVDLKLDDRAFISGVEHHRYRDVLHLHAIVRGAFSDDQLRALKAAWALERGHARVLPVLDGCESYVTKYALKGDTESFDWNLR